MKSPFLRKDKEDPEVKREDKQVKRKKRLDKMSSKGKTETSRYKKLKEKPIAFLSNHGDNTIV